MESQESRHTLHLKPNEKEVIWRNNITPTEIPSLLTLSVRTLETGLPGRIKILLEAREYRDLGKQREVLLEAPGEYSLVVENAENFGQNIEVVVRQRRVEVLREARYILVDRLGRRTFLVSTKEGKYVYKTLPLHEEDRREILRSLMLWSQLDNEGIPKLAEVNLSGNFYIAEYAEGLDLEKFDEELRRRGVRGRELVRTVLEVIHKALEILEYTYMRKIVHGDIKPSNIIYDESGKRVYITDWETCRRADEPLNVRGSFSPPEVTKNMKCSEKSDIYSLGLVLAWLLEWSGEKGTVIPKKLEGIDQETFNALKKLIEGMMTDEVSKRLSPSEAKHAVEELLKNLGDLEGRSG